MIPSPSSLPTPTNFSGTTESKKNSMPLKLSEKGSKVLIVHTPDSASGKGLATTDATVD